VSTLIPVALAMCLVLRLSYPFLLTRSAKVSKIRRIFSSLFLVKLFCDIDPTVEHGSKNLYLNVVQQYLNDAQFKRAPLKRNDHWTD